MFLKLLECWCIAFSFSGVASQGAGKSFSSGYDSRFSNSWNSNNDFSISNNRPFYGNINNAGSNFFSSNERERPNDNKFLPSESEKKFKWGYETPTSNDKMSDWNSKNPRKGNNDMKSNAFDNQPNENKFKPSINSPNSSKWNANSNSFTSNSNGENNSDFSSYEYVSGNSSPDQSDKKPGSWSFNDINKNTPNENSIFSESNNKDNSVYSSWSSNNNKKIKSTPKPYGRWETTTQKSNKYFGDSKREPNKNKKPQSVPETNMWGINHNSQSANEKTSNSSNLDTSILDELDKNDWYFGKESDYPKPPFRSTLQIDVSELWNFDRYKQSNQNPRKNKNGSKMNNNNNNSRRNRQTERLTERMTSIHCECVNVNLCEEEDIIDTQEDIKYGMRSFDEFKCNYLTEVCCANPKIKATTRQSFGEEKTRLQCGQRRAYDNQFESFEDNTAEPGEFPWILKLENAKVNCSASLIHQKMALTAAHCVNSAQPEELILKAGIWNLNNEPSQSRKVKKIIQHPDYNDRKPRNDIALLILETPFELTDNVNTICLPMTNDEWDSNLCVMAGWRTEEILGQNSEILEKEVVDFLPQTDCQNVMLVTDLWRHYILHDSFICGLGESQRKSCMGNEGGFVVCPSKKRPRTYLQIGIVSIGVNCDNFGRPGIFTNVLKFLDWINQNYFELSLF